MKRLKFHTQEIMHAQDLRASIHNRMPHNRLTLFLYILKHRYSRYCESGNGT